MQHVWLCSDWVSLSCACSWRRKQTWRCYLSKVLWLAKNGPETVEPWFTSISLLNFHVVVQVKRKFSSFFKSLVIELDKDLYGPDNHLVEWHRTLTTQETDGFQVIVIAKALNFHCYRSWRTIRHIRLQFQNYASWSQKSRQQSRCGLCLLLCRPVGNYR